MFAVIYPWRVIAGREAEFEVGWRRNTIANLSQSCGLGSRLYRGDDEDYINYAYCPSEQAWAVACASSVSHSDHEARTMFRDAIDDGGFQTLLARPAVIDELSALQP